MFDFKTIQVQATIFTPESPPRISKLLAHFLSKRSDIFNGEPITFEQPPMIRVGPNLPRVILSNEDRTLRMQIASGRFDVTAVASSPATGVDQTERLALAVDLIGEYLGVTNLSVGKLGFSVVNAFFDQNPARTISRRFCRDEWLSGPIEDSIAVELSVQKPSALAEGLEVISSWRCRSGELINTVENKSEGKAVVFEQDLSTLGDDPTTREFTADEIRSFFVLAPDEQRRIFGLYFPISERTQ